MRKYKGTSFIYFDQRYRAPLFSVANSKQEFYALLITKGDVRGDVESEKYAKNL